MKKENLPLFLALQEDDRIMIHDIPHELRFFPPSTVFAEKNRLLSSCRKIHKGEITRKTHLRNPDNICLVKIPVIRVKFRATVATGKIRCSAELPYLELSRKYKL